MCCNHCCTFRFQLTRGSFKWPFLDADSGSARPWECATAAPFAAVSCCCKLRPLVAFCVMRLLKIYAVYESHPCSITNSQSVAESYAVQLVSGHWLVMLLLRMMMWRRAIKQQFNLETCTKAAQSC